MPSKHRVLQKHNFNKTSEEEELVKESVFYNSTDLDLENNYTRFTEISDEASLSD